ncbi:MAG: hypothetical protein QF357_05635, partial [Dehalococcoidia bacterium]|nr:hypothetical protein [Dehalococcoidia bacterium]
SERCNEVLTIAAVIGRQFRFDVLKQLVEDTTEGQLLDVLDESLSARIVEEIPDEIGLYQFTHASMQETLTAELSANRTVRMHARIAEALEKHYGDEANVHAAELVEHFAEAEVVLGTERLVHYSLYTGESALDAFGHEEALHNFERALAALSGSEPTELRARIYAGLAHAQAATSSRSELRLALDSMQTAFDLHLEVGNQAEAVNVALSYFPPHSWHQGDG